MIFFFFLLVLYCDVSLLLAGTVLRSLAYDNIFLRLYCSLGLEIGLGPMQVLLVFCHDLLVIRRFLWCLCYAIGLDSRHFCGIGLRVQTVLQGLGHVCFYGFDSKWNGYASWFLCVFVDSYFF